MCFNNGSNQKSNEQLKREQPAPPPAAPLGIPEEPEIGSARRKETRKRFKADAPTYRVNRKDSPAAVPTKPIKM